MKIINNLLEYKNLKIYQETDMFKFSLDSILLARFVNLNKKNNILDIGTNNGIIPLILSTQTRSHIDGIEIQKEACDIAKENIKLNNLENRINIINQDVKEYYKNNIKKYDCIVANPPYFKKANSNKKNIIFEKTIARHEFYLTLEELIISVKRLIENNGNFYIIHLAERIDEIINELTKNNFSIKNIQFIYPKRNKEANRVLVDARRTCAKKISILPPILCHNIDGSYTDEIKKYFRDEIK